MSIETLEQAMAATKTFTEKPSNEELLQLYSLYKQATVGDNSEDAPSGFNFVAAAKHNAWEKLKGMPQEEASEKYIALVKSLQPKYS
ncbi:MAG: acyl-CoA-binding protein [Nitritalea sp.]